MVTVWRDGFLRNRDGSMLVGVRMEISSGSLRLTVAAEKGSPGEMAALSLMEGLHGELAQMGVVHTTRVRSSVNVDVVDTIDILLKS